MEQFIGARELRSSLSRILRALDPERPLVVTVRSRPAGVLLDYGRYRREPVTVTAPLPSAPPAGRTSSTTSWTSRRWRRLDGLRRVPPPEGTAGPRRDRRPAGEAGPEPEGPGGDPRVRRGRGAAVRNGRGADPGARRGAEEARETNREKKRLPGLSTWPCSQVRIEEAGMTSRPSKTAQGCR